MAQASSAVSLDRSPKDVSQRARRVAFTVWVTVLSLTVGVVFVGVTLLTVGMWMADPSYQETNPVVDLGFFALGGVVVGAGLVSQLRAPEQHIAGLQQAVIGLLALAMCAFVGGRVEPMWGGLILVLATAIVVALHPARGELMRSGWGVSAPLAALALIGAAPAILYAQRMLDLAREAGPSCFLGQCARGDRFAEVAALAIALVLVTMLASVRTRGWRVSAWSVGIAATILGLCFVALPDVPGALDPAWGTLAVLWGFLVVVAAELQIRRADTAHHLEGGSQP